MADVHTVWKKPATHPTLLPEDVHVWRVDIGQPQAIVQSLRSLLSLDESAKGDRFYFEKDRQRYIISHSALRILLARYLGIPLTEARTLPFRHNDYGKPSLFAAHALSPNFNLSHSQDLALLAFARTRQLGVDVEYMRPILDYETLAQRYFSPREYAALLALPLAIRREGFYHCWTQKEAYIKARGMGLSLPLDSFDVSIHPSQPARLLASRENLDEVARWALYALQPGVGYAAALAVEAQEPAVRLHCWQLVTLHENL